MAKIPNWLYNTYIDCYNGSITLYNQFVDRWNYIATEEPEENIITTEMHNLQTDEYNRHIDDYNAD